MHALDLRPRSASELVDAGFRLLRRHYGAFLTLSALANIPSLLFQLLRIQLERGTSSAGLAFVALGLILVMFPFYGFTESALTVLASDAYQSGVADVGSAMRRAAPRALAAAGAFFLVGLAVGVGLLALLIPGIYLMSRMYTTLTATVLEQVGPGKAVSRTWARTRGRAGHVLATLGLMFLLYVVCFIGITLVAGVASAAGSELLGLVITTVVTALIYPILPIVTTLLYYDLRIRAEGYDLEVLSGQLDGPPLGAGAATR